MCEPGVVVAVSWNAKHGLSKPVRDEIVLLTGLGVVGDAHLGETVQHLYDAKRDPTRPNLRQVHLIHEELQDELRDAGFAVSPGVMGENVTTRGVDLLSLPRGTKLHLGAEAVVEITGLRNPCWQLDAYQKGLMAANVGRDGAGGRVLKAGVMGVVLHGGTIRPGEAIRIALPPEPHLRLERV